MPIRSFECEQCQIEFKKLTSTDSVDCPDCGTNLSAKLPTSFNSTIYETRDRYTGTKIRKGQEQQMRKRMNDHHDRYELAQKIDKYGMDDATRSGWLKKIKKV